MSADNVILDTVKKAEDGSDACILRLYEATNARTHCLLKTDLPVKEAYITNLLEESLRPIPVEDGSIALQLRGFEILTLKLVLS